MVNLVNIMNALVCRAANVFSIFNNVFYSIAKYQNWCTVFSGYFLVHPCLSAQALLYANHWVAKQSGTPTHL